MPSFLSCDDGMDALYVQTHDGRFIEKKMYQQTASLWARWQDAWKEGTSEADELARIAQVPVEIAQAVIQNEIWEKECRERRETEAQYFRRLREIIRDSEDMSFGKKLDFLAALEQMPRKMRLFFCALYGADDGIPKRPEEIAGQLMMTPEAAKKFCRDMLEGHRMRSSSCVMQDREYGLLLELQDFLLENEKNKRAFETYCKRRKRLRSKKLKDYLE